jgi:hypothetical protein
MKVYNSLSLLIILYERAIWTLRKKRIKKIYINRDDIFQKNSAVEPFTPQKERKNFGELKVEPV